MLTNLTTETDCTAAVGCAVEELDTPALLLDWNAAQRNLRRMADYFTDRRCKLRPHFKNHKCTTLARKQLEAGKCVGITCAKLDEAQILTDAGFDDVLIANQVMGTRKIARLAQVARQTRLAVAVDHVDQARQISQAADAADVTIGVMVEVDTGMGRCGVMPAPANAALELARGGAALRSDVFPGRPHEVSDAEVAMLQSALNDMAAGHTPAMEAPR